ncbi:MAG: hypothetical protein JST04_02825 [Bdellovibrionales bacterium]|nr:hypothetical protein [Bdellovibrionales bacterium]
MKSTSMIRIVSLAAVCALTAGSALAVEGTSETMRERGMLPGDQRAAFMPEVGILAGGAGNNGEAYNNSGSFAAEVGVTPWKPFSVGLQAQYSPSTVGPDFANIDFNTTNFLLKGVVSLGVTDPILSHVYVGTKSGIAMYTGDIDTQTHFALGGVLGFDVPLMASQKVSLGAEGTYLGVLGGDDNNLTPDQTSVLGSMKYWF